jgi:hypothetical protein
MVQTHKLFSCVCQWLPRSYSTYGIIPSYPSKKDSSHYEVLCLCDLVVIEHGHLQNTQLPL